VGDGAAGVTGLDYKHRILGRAQQTGSRRI